MPKGVYQRTEEYRAKQSVAHKGKKLSLTTKKKISAVMTGDKHPMFGKHRSEETKAKISAAQVGKRHSLEAREKISVAHKGKHYSEETRAKMSVSAKQRCTPEWQEKMRAVMNHPERCAKISAATTKQRAIEEQNIHSELRCRRTRNVLKAHARIGLLKKTKAELTMENFLNEHFSNEYKFVGLGDFVIAGKCPDFVCINGQKKIIEVLGDNGHRYVSHSPKQLQERAELFTQYGYSTLYVNAEELEHLQNLENKVNEFHCGWLGT